MGADLDKRCSVEEHDRHYFAKRYPIAELKVQVRFATTAYQRRELLAAILLRRLYPKRYD